MSLPTALLDVDGTLVDTNYQHALAWFRAFRRHGIVLPIWRIHRRIGMGGDHLVAALCGDDAERRIGKRVREAVDGWTTAADVEHTKLDPDLVAAGKAKAGGGDAVLVGDSTWDCEAGRRCAVPTIALLTGGFSARELRDAGAACVFESIAELCERIAETPLA